MRGEGENNFLNSSKDSFIDFTKFTNSKLKNTTLVDFQRNSLYFFIVTLNKTSHTTPILEKKKYYPTSVN